MEKIKINEVIKGHEQELIVASLNNAELSSSDDNMTNLLSRCIKYAKGSTDCLLLTGDDIRNMIGHDVSIINPDGDKLSINSMVFFGVKSE